MKKFFKVNFPVWKSVFLGVTATWAKSGENLTESVKEDSCSLLLTAFGVLNIGVLGGRQVLHELYILTGVLQSNVFWVPNNDF